jgi:hypothetical protein
MKNRTVYKQSPIRKVRRNKALLKGFFILLIFIAVIVGISYLFKIKAVTVNEVKVEGNHVIFTEDIIDKVNSDISGSYLYIFPKNNIFLVPKNTIEHNLLSHFKRIENIHVFMRDTTLYVSISERQATYLWCGNSMSESIDNSKCYFLDDKGYIFSTSPYFSGNVYVKIYGGLADDDTSVVGKNILGGDTFIKLIEFFDHLSSLELSPFAVLVKDNTEFELFLDDPIQNKNAPKILFKKDADYNKLFINLDSALKTNPLMDDFKKNFSNLLYLDLRFDNKVYYKFSPTSTQQ